MGGQWRFVLLFACGASAAVAAACGDSGPESTFGAGGGGDDGGGAPGDDTGTGPVLGDGSGGDGYASVHASALVFVPPSQTLTLDGVTPQTATYTLQATLLDGTLRTVNAESLQFDRPDLATLTSATPATLTASGTYAGTGKLHAIYGGASATATLTIVVHQKNLNGVAAGIISKLDAATAVDPSGLQSILYPYDKTVWPLGLTSPLIMWNAPNAGDTYRIHLEQNTYTYDMYTTVAPPAQVRVDQAAWDRVTASNAGGSGDPLKFVLSRYSAATGLAYKSVAYGWTVAPASLRGAIYYWTASAVPAGDGGLVRVGHISRFRPGTGAAPQPLNQSKCMGCHAVSADGTTLVADVNDPSAPSSSPYGNWSGTRAWASFDITQQAAPLITQTTKFGADVALSPDGKYVVFGGPAADCTGSCVSASPLPAGSHNISLGDPKTGTVYPNSGLDAVAGLDTTTTIMMPAFSPDGTKLALVKGNAGFDNVIAAPTSRPDGGVPVYALTIAYLDFNATAGTFSSTLHTIVDSTNAVFATTGQGLAYPSFTPDSKAVAYHAGSYQTGCNNLGCDDTTPDDGSLFIHVLGQTSPIRLTAADDPPLAADRGLAVEPTFNPQARGGFSWAVFTSLRDWGNKLTGTALNTKRRLWVTPIDTTIGTTDPSHPAIYLEGQEDRPNMRGFWALASCTSSVPPGTPGGACGAGFECCSGFCNQGSCVDVSKIACAGVGDSCTTAADCCNSQSVACVGGVCTAIGTH
jgi:hypothetical protein